MLIFTSKHAHFLHVKMSMSACKNEHFYMQKFSIYMWKHPQKKNGNKHFDVPSWTLWLSARNNGRNRKFIPKIHLVWFWGPYRLWVTRYGENSILKFNLSRQIGWDFYIEIVWFAKIKKISLDLPTWIEFRERIRAVTRYLEPVSTRISYQMDLWV